MNDLLRFLPAELHGQAVYAGGWVAHPERANDIDLWVLTTGDQEFFRARAKMYVHLSALGLGDCIADDTEGYGPDHHLVATIPTVIEGDLPLQLLLSNKGTPQALVDSFDISTHACAMGVHLPLMNGRKRWWAKRWTSLLDIPRVMRWDTPADTLGRLEKICARYDLVADADDLRELVVLAAAHAYKLRHAA